MNLNFLKASETAKTPKRSNPGDAGLDLVASKLVKNGLFSVWYETDIAVEIPKGCFGILVPRSSVSNDGNLMLANSIGVIDSGYRSTIQVRFNRTFKGFFTRGKYKIGDRIAQIIIVPFKNLEPVQVPYLSASARDVKGFGSSGK